jgi:hypothetical protein
MSFDVSFGLSGLLSSFLISLGLFSFASASGSAGFSVFSLIKPFET